MTFSHMNESPRCVHYCARVAFFIILTLIWCTRHNFSTFIIRTLTLTLPDSCQKIIRRNLKYRGATFNKGAKVFSFTMPCGCLIYVVIFFSANCDFIISSNHFLCLNCLFSAFRINDRCVCSVWTMLFGLCFPLSDKELAKNISFLTYLSWLLNLKRDYQ